jgi:hypothetical protein
MPKATVNIDDQTRHELKTLEGGFVVLRKLTYGQSLQRQSMLSMRMIRDAESKRKGETKGEMNLANIDVTTFDFTHCIVDHNLEDENGAKLDLRSPVVFARLDPRVGQEIDTLIQKQNSFDDESLEAEGNSLPA